MANLGIPKNTIEIIQKYNFAFQKKFGQNFLIDTHVLEKIISAAGVTKDDMVLEIGPGIGTMTQYLAEHAKRVVAVEIDCNLIPILEETLAGYDNITVINDDILKVDVDASGREYNGGKAHQSGGQSALLHHDPHHYGAVREQCSYRQHHGDGAEGGG